MGAIRKRGRIYWIRWYRDGRRFEESSGSTKYDVARSLLRSREGDVEKGVPVTPKLGRITFDDAVAAVVVFLLALIVLSLIGSAIARRVRGSSLSALDRTLGFIFGLARGGVVCSLAYMALSWSLAPQDWPDWAQGARTRPLLANGADALKSLVPGETRARGAAAAADAQRAFEQAREADRAIRALAMPGAKPAGAAGQGVPAAKAYDATQRKDMDRLFQNAQ
jgi:membrane protein required for colicin V production